MSATFPSNVTLYVWPGQWGLPSFDPVCLAAVLYLQLAIPGKFRVAECSNPDSSPTGQLPYLVHEQHYVTSFTSIVKYIAGLYSADNETYPNANLDVHLSASEKAQRTAWCSHAESHLGDLVYYTLFSASKNWTGLVHPVLANMFLVPQKYYVPRRIRDGYYPRLNAAGLWEHLTEDPPENKPFDRSEKPTLREGLKKNATLTHAFEREKIIQKAHTELELYDELLRGKVYLFQNQVSSTDLLIAAHLLLLVSPPLPDATIQNLLKDSHPSLASYAQNIYGLAFGADKNLIEFVPTQSSIWSLIPSWPERPKPSKPQSPEEIHYNRMRWSFFGLVLGAFTAYFAVVGRNYRVVFVNPSREVEGEEEEEEEEEGEGEREMETS